MKGAVCCSMYVVKHKNTIACLIKKDLRHPSKQLYSQRRIKMLINQFTLIAAFNVLVPVACPQSG